MSSIASSRCFDLDEEIKRIDFQAQQPSAALHVLRVDGAPAFSIAAIEALIPMAQLIVAAQGSRRLILQYQIPVPTELDVPDRVALVLDAYVAVGDYHYIQLLVLKGSADIREINGERQVSVTSEDLSAHSAYKIHNSDVGSFPLQQKADEIERELSKEGIGLVFIHSFLSPESTST